MTHAYCASGVVQFSSKRSPVYEALSERGALQEGPVRTRGDGVSWASRPAVDRLTELKPRAGKTARENGKEKTFLSPSSAQNR